MLMSGFERLFDPLAGLPFMGRRGFGPRAEFPPYNVWLAEEKAVITTELPGVNPDDLDISVTGKVVTLKGQRGSGEFKDGETYHRRERWQGRFNKSIELPYNIEGSRVSASYQRGVLRIELPRAEAEKPKKIDIKSE